MVNCFKPWAGRIGCVFFLGVRVGSSRGEDSEEQEWDGDPGASLFLESIGWVFVMFQGRALNDSWRMKQMDIFGVYPLVQASWVGFELTAGPSHGQGLITNVCVCVCDPCVARASRLLCIPFPLTTYNGM